MQLPPSSPPHTLPGNRASWNLVVTWWRVAFGTHLLYSGIAFAWTGWVPLDMSQANDGTGRFLIELDRIGLYACVKYFEILVGTLLVTNRAVPLALVVHMPVTMMIAYLNLVVQPYERQLYTGPQELGFHIPLLIAYGGYYAPFLRWQTTAWWLTENLPARGAAPPARPDEAIQSSTGTGLGTALLIVGVVSALILAGSYLLSPPARQLVPRDWAPIVGGSVALLWAWFATSRRQ